MSPKSYSLNKTEEFQQMAICCPNIQRRFWCIHVTQKLKLPYALHLLPRSRLHKIQYRYTSDTPEASPK